MSDFLKRFLLEDPRSLSASGRYVALAAFGKHPGWDDHIEPRNGQETRDLGLETESLNVAKAVLYVKGIGGQIDSGAWEKPDDAQILPAFKHVFVWQRSGQILVGRLWSSSDGKGRKRYPMVVCVHFVGVSLAWALKQALPVLAELEDGCLGATSAAEVCSLLSRKRALLRQAIQSNEPQGDYAPVSPDVLHKILQPLADAKSNGFLRVLYQIQNQLGKFKPGTSTAAVRAQQIRVPVAAENPEQALLFWTRFFLTQVAPSTPLLLTLPLEMDWIDVTVGDPESHEFFCLRASAKAVPLASEVPYNLDDSFRAQATAFLDDFRRGKTPTTDLTPTPARADAPAPPKSKWLKWLAGGAVAVAGAAAAMLFLPNRDQQARIEPSSPKTLAAAAFVKGDTTPVAVPVAATGKLEVARAEASLNTQAEAVRHAEEQRKSNAVVAAAKFKTEAAAKERERQLAEATRLKKGNETVAPLQTPPAKSAETVVAVVSKTAESRPASATVPAAVSTRTEMTNSIGMVLMQLPSGIWVGKYEVTQAEYRKVMGTDAAQSVSERRPVDRVAWSEAREFCRKLTEMERGKLAGKVYSLPTANQWTELLGSQKFEDLPRGGLTGKWYPSAVGEGGATNQFGLFDVLGNVWEWCLDGGTGDEKLLKGGAFNTAKYERKWLPGQPVSNCGFRCILTAP